MIVSGQKSIAPSVGRGHWEEPMCMSGDICATTFVVRMVAERAFKNSMTIVRSIPGGQRKRHQVRGLDHQIQLPIDF